jgi:TPP-dependent 2-oxoacid decarboxylase
MVLIKVLNAKEEEVVLQRLKAIARDNCRKEMDELVKCTKTKTFSMFWKCNVLNEEAQSCLSKFTGHDTLLKMRIAEIDKKCEYLKAHNKYPESS